jgi:hypothetical protein
LPGPFAWLYLTLEKAGKCSLEEQVSSSESGALLERRRGDKRGGTASSTCSAQSVLGTVTSLYFLVLLPFWDTWKLPVPFPCGRQLRDSGSGQ